MGTDTRDGKWEVDLLWKYLRETEGPGRRTGYFFEYTDPKGTLNDRGHVYKMLVAEPSQTNPSGEAQIGASMIPWNQLNKGMVKKMGHELGCGTVVKLTFQKYMTWPWVEDKAIPGRYVDQSWDAVGWLVQSLKAGQPARAHMRKKSHFIGIVGFRGPKTNSYGRHEFLCIDPWPGGSETGGNTITYAGGVTKFLGVAYEDKENKKLMYDTYEITKLEGFFPHKPNK